MQIRRLRGWELPERVATAESVAHDRRRVLRALGIGVSPRHSDPARAAVEVRIQERQVPRRRAVHRQRPGTFWNDLAPDKYGLSSNVDPTETKPWPQSHETMLGTNEQRPTLPYNGYGEWVARLYA